MRSQISDVLKEYDKQFRSSDNIDLINSGSFECKVDSGVNIVISPITSQMYSLCLDFDCFDICINDDRKKIEWLGCLFYEDYDPNKVNDPVYVGSKIYMTDMAFEEYLTNFKNFLRSVEGGIKLSLSYPYRFIVSDNENLDFEYLSSLDIKYNSENDSTTVRVRMDLRDKFSVILGKCEKIDIILEGN